MQAKKVYAYIHKNGYKTKLMAAAIRNKQDVFSLLGYFSYYRSRLIAMDVSLYRTNISEM